MEDDRCHERQATVSESIQIEAWATALYDLVADVARMGEWSPEATGARLRASQGPLRVGDRFVGQNKRGVIRWSTVCSVTRADRGSLFEFAVAVGVFKISTWRYTFEQDGHTTLVTEEWIDERSGLRGSVIKGIGQVIIPGARPDHNRRNIQTTLSNLKREAEA